MWCSSSNTFSSLLFSSLLFSSLLFSSLSLSCPPFMPLQISNTLRMRLMSSGTRRAPFSLCGSSIMTKPKDCLSLPSAGRFYHQVFWYSFQIIFLFWGKICRCNSHSIKYFKDNIFDCLPQLSVFVFQCLFWEWLIDAPLLNRNKKYQDLFAVGMGSCK